MTMQFTISPHSPLAIHQPSSAQTHACINNHPTGQCNTVLIPATIRPKVAQTGPALDQGWGWDVGKASPPDPSSCKRCQAALCGSDQYSTLWAHMLETSIKKSKEKNYAYEKKVPLTLGGRLGTLKVTTMENSSGKRSQLEKILEAGKLMVRGSVAENWSPSTPSACTIRIPLVAPFIGTASARMSRG